VRAVKGEESRVTDERLFPQRPFLAVSAAIIRGGKVRHDTVNPNILQLR